MLKSTAAIEDAILFRGPVSIILEASTAFQQWRPSATAQFPFRLGKGYSAKLTSTNHAVNLIGWAPCDVRAIQLCGCMPGARGII